AELRAEAEIAQIGVLIRGEEAIGRDVGLRVRIDAAGDLPDLAEAGAETDRGERAGVAAGDPDAPTLARIVVEPRIALRAEREVPGGGDGVDADALGEVALAHGAVRQPAVEVTATGRLAVAGTDAVRIVATHVAAVVALDVGARHRPNRAKLPAV